MDLLLPELLLMTSLTLLLAFFLARLISVAANTPTPPSSQHDRPLLHAAPVDKAAAVGPGPEEAGEGEMDEQREGEQQQEKRDAAAAPFVPDRIVDDHRDNLDDGGIWREVEIVVPREGDETGWPGLLSDDDTGVFEPEPEPEEQGKQERERKKIVPDVHVISAREAEVEDKPKPTPHAEDVGTVEEDKPKPTPPTVDDFRTATAITIAIAPPVEGLLSEEEVETRPSDPATPHAETENETTLVPVEHVTAVKPEEGRSSSSNDDDDDDDDDWEGIEASELRKLFATAASFVASPAGVDAVSRLPADVQLQLHGLHKAATEGPCFEAQPMPLKITARAKWHAWQKLGDMNPEVAMEQYISMLSEKVPGWMVNPKVNIVECEPSDSSVQHQPMKQTERNPEFN